jgi:hypothetical protein
MADHAAQNNADLQDIYALFTPFILQIKQTIILFATQNLIIKHFSITAAFSSFPMSGYHNTKSPFTAMSTPKTLPSFHMLEPRSN